MDSTSAADLTVRSPWLRVFARLHGWFYVLGGIWPVVSPRTFQALTAPKMDFWLAQTVGLVLAVIGVVVLLAARERHLTKEIALLAGGVALVIGLVDLYGVTQPRTTSAYLLDAPAEFVLAAIWAVAWWRAPSPAATRRPPR